MEDLPPGWHEIEGTGKYGFWQGSVLEPYGDVKGTFTGRTVPADVYKALVEDMSEAEENEGAGATVGGYSPSAVSAGTSTWSKLKFGLGVAGAGASVKAIAGEGLGVMEAVRSWPVLKTIGTIGLAATSFEVGYKVGGLVADLFGFSEGSEDAVGGRVEYEAVGQKVVGAGEYLCGLAATSYGSCQEAHALAVPVPELVTVWDQRFNSGGWSETVKTLSEDIGVETEGFYTATFGHTPDGAVFSPLGGEGGYGCASPPGCEAGVWLSPLVVSQLPESSQHGSPKKTVEGSVPTPVSKSAAESKVEACDEESACAALAGWWAVNDERVAGAVEVAAPPRGVSDADPLEPGKVVIPVPHVGELYSHYDERLEVLGLKPVPSALGELTYDPAIGPEQVAETNPRFYAEVQPGTEVRVRYNPATAPEGDEVTETEAGGEGGSWSPPSIPSISLAPLSEVHIGCNQFPFGFFCWYGEALTSWGSEGTCPSFSLPVGHATHTDDDGELGTDLCVLEPAMNIVRPILVLLGTLGIGLFFAYAAMGLGGSGGDD